MNKKGLKEFHRVYDLTAEITLLGLDLAQNLCLKHEVTNPKHAIITEEDVHMAYGVAGMGKKYPIKLFDAVHDLAKALGYTKEDYTENSGERRGQGNCNIHVIGEGRSINCDLGYKK